MILIILVLLLLVGITVGLLAGRRRQPDGLDFCSHCGALWDERHEVDGCPVMGATSRILGVPEDVAAEHQRERRHGLKETTRASSGRGDW